MQLTHLVKSVWKKYSLLRTYENDFVRHLKLSGLGIDLGAKSRDAKYYEYLNMDYVSRMEFVDYFHSGDGVIKIDLENDFPIEDDKYDFVLSFNVTEHIYNYDKFISESIRILKEGGTIHGFVPFMVRFHPDPNDYFRFTGQALEKMLENTGIEHVIIKPIAYGPFKVAFSQIGHVIRIRVLRFILYMTGILMDKLFSIVSSGSKNYAMAYYFSGVKCRRIK